MHNAFVPRSDTKVLLYAEYYQIELIIMAALAEDNEVIPAFKEVLDIMQSAIQGGCLINDLF